MWIRRSILPAALAAVVTLAGCGRQQQPIVSMPSVASMTEMGSQFPTGPAPDSVPATAMVATALLPASAMTSRTPTARTTLAFGKLTFTQIPGIGSQASFGPTGTLYVLSDQPYGPDKYIFAYDPQAKTYTNIPGLASRLAPSPDGSLYAINSAGGLFRYANGSWAGLGGASADVAVDPNGAVYVISKNGQPDGPIYRNVAGTWSQIAGAGARLAAYPDSSLYVTTSGSAIYATSTTAIAYERCPGAASRIVPIAASAGGGFLALGIASYGGTAGIYQFSPQTPGSCANGTYTALGGDGIDLGGNAANIAVLATNGAIYTAPLPAANAI